MLGGYRLILDDFRAHLEDEIIHFLLSQGCTAAFYHSRPFQLQDALPFFFVVMQAVDCCVFLHNGVGFAFAGDECSVHV